MIDDIKTIKKNEKEYLLTFFDENHQPCEEEKAYMVSISEYDENGNFIRSVIGIMDKNKDQEKENKKQE